MKALDFQILLVDDEATSPKVVSICRYLERELAARVTPVATVEKALDWLGANGHQPCVAVVDFFLNGRWRGDTATEAIRGRFPAVEVVLLTGDTEVASNEKMLQNAAAAGAHGFVAKGAPTALLTQIRHTIEYLTLRHVDRIIHTNTNAWSHWETILNAALRLTGATYGQVLEYYPSRGELVLRASQSTPLQFKSLRLSVKQQAGQEEWSIARLVALTGKTIHIADLGKSEQKEREHYHSLVEGMQSSLTVPIRRWEHPKGVIGVINIESELPSKFDEHTVRLLERDLADRAAIALDNDRKRRRHRSLYHAGRHVTKSIELSKVLNTILKEACKLVDADYGGILLRVVGEESLELAQRWPEHVDGTELLNVGQRFAYNAGYQGINNDGRVGVVARAARTLKSQLVNDSTKDPDYVPCLNSINSELAVCMTWDGKRLLGVLNLEKRIPMGFTSADRRVVEMLATQAATAVNNALKYAELQKAREVIDLHLAVMGIAACRAVVDHKLTKHISNVEVGLALVHSLLNKSAASKSETGRVMLDTVLRMREEIRRAIETTPKSTDVIDPRRAEPVALNDFVRAICMRTERNHSDALPTLRVIFDTEVPSKGAVRASRYWLDQAMTNLMENAIDAFVRTGTVSPSLQVRLKQIGSKVLLEIHDNGPGIPAWIREQLGRSQIRKEEGEMGQGIGFLWSKYIISAYGGDVSVEPSCPVGSLVKVWLPLEWPG